jgi:3-vinyl bacteriochlorophyllide hydratase
MTTMERAATVSEVRALYSPQERLRRDESVWTLVQGVLAPLQFLVFLVSLALVLRFFYSGEGFETASWSVLAKTALLYLIMVTGAIWEKVVFGQYLFAPAFFWEDLVSMLVIALHSLYLWVWWQGHWPERFQLGLALAAYASYLVNAVQFLLKLRQARLQGQGLCEGAAS